MRFLRSTTTDMDVIHSTTMQTVEAPVKKLTCGSFSYQQDAQAAYVANLSDPWGLDGNPGPMNGDGLACTQLPVDPSRAVSIAVDAYQPPISTPATKADLVDPALDYYGVAEDGLPGSSAIFNSLSTTVGKAPSSLEWYSYWDTPYDSTKVKQSWSHGALPMITWMSEATYSTSPTAASYTLANIVAGHFDSYLLQYAGSVVGTGLPVVIRLDQEMNGNWFPWSAGFSANKAAVSGQANLYVQAWQHVWDIFNSVGANNDVIWLWTPNRVDNITPHLTAGGSAFETNPAEDYPGDQFVDWIGTDAYDYKPTDGWTYQTTFAKTLAALHAISNKPIYIAETGATEAVGMTDYAAQKAQWIQQTLAGFLADSSIIGFTWFNNNVSGVHVFDGMKINTDWQYTSSPQAQTAFIAGVTDIRYSSGVMPDTAGG